LTGVLRIVFLMATSFSIQYRIAVVAQWIIVITLPVIGALKGFDVATIVYQVLYLLVLAVCLSWVCYSNERDWKFRYDFSSLFC
jgi:hypothetical protein